MWNRLIFDVGSKQGKRDQNKYKLKIERKPIKFDRFMLYEAMRSMALSGWLKCEMGDSITLFFVLKAKYSSSRAALF